jgi:hypothetical protein
VSVRGKPLRQRRARTGSRDEREIQILRRNRHQQVEIVSVASKCPLGGDLVVVALLEVSPEGRSRFGSSVPPAVYRFLRLVLDAVFGVSVLSLHGLGQSLMLQVAKKASVLKRRKSRNRMEAPGTPQGDTPVQAVAGSGPNSAPSRCESDSDVVFYMEEPKAGECLSPFHDPGSRAEDG